MDARRRTEIAEQQRLRAQKAHWSPWQLARSIHDLAETPTLLMAWRLATGHTQDEVCAGIRGLALDDGQSCGLGCPQLSRWESGKERPGSFYRRLLSRWYRASVDRLGLGNDSGCTPPAEEDPVDRRRFLSLAAAAPLLAQLDEIRTGIDTHLGVMPTPADIEHWRDVVVGHVGAYGQVAPSELLARLTPDMAALAGLCQRHPHQRDLHVAAARLAGLVGAIYTDLDQDRDARDWLHTAAQLAEVSGELETRCWIVMAQAMTALYSPHVGHVLTIASRAPDAVRQAGPAAAQLAGLTARAHARLGHAAEARQALDQAHHLSTKLTGAQQSETFFGFPARELAMYTSQVLTDIRSGEAWDAQQRALDAYPAGDVMDRPLILFDRARLLIAQGEARQGAQVAGDAVTCLDPAMRVPLLMSRAAQVGTLLAQADAGIAADYRERIAA
ncbi:hypothetical protein [Nonomuraea sp. bgisy101]|uniref:hypothetical protein n=1 Tax=Nonomuraea sp. bgisy101 TaxID=3413784 RepID=UPI003D7261D1